MLALYAWGLFQGSDSIDQLLVVSRAAAVAAGTGILYGIVTALFSPRKQILILDIIGYYIVLVMIALLIQGTAYIGSPFIALWMLASLFAAVFGIYGIAAIIAGTVAYLTILATSGQLNFDVIALTTIFTVLPLIIGHMVWRPAGRNQVVMTSNDNSLVELTNQLNATSGQSEIVIAAITDGVISIDSDGIIELINPAAQRMVGWGRADAVGLDYKLVLKMLDTHDNVPNELNDPVQQALSKHVQTRSDSFRVQAADTGKSFYASITTTPVGERMSSAIIMFRDITNENEEERQRSEFISTASHEMRTPVASIEGYLGLALNPATAAIDEKAREYIGKAQDSARHLGRLFQDLLDVSKADDGRLSNNPTIIELIPFIHDIILGQLPASRAKGLEIQYPPQPDLSAKVNVVDEDKEEPNKTIGPVLYVNVDADHLREIVSNLIENAIKYTPKGIIKVDVSSDTDFVIVSIQDSGIGIPKEDQPHLFQKFYRVDSSTTREIGGTGLGLYLSRRLAEAIGGSLWVESVYGEGSTFFLKLPRIRSVDAERILAEQRTALPKPKLAQPASAAPPSRTAIPVQAAQQPTISQAVVPVVRAASVTSAQPIATSTPVQVQALSVPPASPYQPPTQPSMPLTMPDQIVKTFQPQAPNTQPQMPAPPSQPPR